MIIKQKPTLKKYSKSAVIYVANHSSYKHYRDIKNLVTFLSNQSILLANFLMI